MRICLVLSLFFSRIVVFSQDTNLIIKSDVYVHLSGANCNNDDVERAEIFFIQNKLLPHRFVYFCQDTSIIRRYKLMSLNTFSKKNNIPFKVIFPTDTADKFRKKYLGDVDSEVIKAQGKDSLVLLQCREMNLDTEIKIYSLSWTVLKYLKIDNEDRYHYNRSIWVNKVFISYLVFDGQIWRNLLDLKNKNQKWNFLRNSQ